MTKDHNHSEMQSNYCPVCGENLENQRIPVKEGETIITEIDDLGSKGDGIARINNGDYVVFIPSGKVGETVKAEITSVGTKFAFAEKTWPQV